MAATTNKKQAKKQFFDVKAGIISTRVSLYAATAQELVGRVIKLDLTRSLRGKSLEMQMKIKQTGEELEAEPISLELVGSYIRRMIRKGTDYVEDSFQTSCKDAVFIVKPFMITRKKVPRSVRNELRKGARQYIEAHLTTRTAKEVFNEVITGKIQKELSLKLKKIYPLAMCELRVLAFAPGKKELAHFKK